MNSLLRISVVFIVLLNYSGFSYGESSEERAKESLRSQIDPKKKSNKRATEHQAESTRTKDPIRPFGPFSWEDDLLTAVIKANGLPGIEQISLSFEDDEMGVDLRSIQNKEQLQGVLTKYLKSPFFAESSVEVREHHFSEYLDPEGKKSVFTTTPINVRVSPVVLAGVPFSLTISLGSSPGLPIVHPDKVPRAILNLKDPKESVQVAFPVVVGEVTLHSDSPILFQKLTDIEKILEDKYRKYDPDRHRIREWRQPGLLHDPGSQGLTWLEVHGPIPFTLKYHSTVFLKSLNQLYVEHVATLETKKLGNRVDLKEGL